MKTQIRKQTITQSKKKQNLTQNQQKLSQNQDQNPQVNTRPICLGSVAGVWGEENSLSWVFNWVLGRKKLERDYWKLKNSVEKVRFFLSGFVKVIFLLLLSICSATVVFLTQNSVTYFCGEVKYSFSPQDEFGPWRHVGCYLVFSEFLLLGLTYTVSHT